MGEEQETLGGEHTRGSLKSPLPRALRSTAAMYRQINQPVNTILNLTTAPSAPSRGEMGKKIILI